MPLSYEKEKYMLLKQITSLIMCNFEVIASCHKNAKYCLLDLLLASIHTDMNQTFQSWMMLAT